MRMIIASVVIPAALAATAAAQPPASVGDIVTTPLPGTNIVLARKLLPASKAPGVMAQSKVIYLNHRGVTLTPGEDDSTTNHSSIIGGTSVVPAWNTSPATWNATVACMQDMFSRFDVTVTDQDPGATPHIEAVFGGSPQDIGMGQGVGGVSPFTEDCGIIENSIVFTFTDVFPDDAQTVCEVMSQEVAHSYGLDHEMLASDPMTYLQYNGNRSFKDQTVSCGEYQNRPCGIGGSTCRANQNSVQLLYARVGKADLVRADARDHVACGRRDGPARLLRRGDGERRRRRDDDDALDRRPAGEHGRRRRPVHVRHRSGTRRGPSHAARRGHRRPQHAGAVDHGDRRHDAHRQ